MQTVGIQINEARAPYVIFERREVEDRKASIEAGRYVPMDVDFALITPHGSRDQIDRVATEWLDHLESEGKQGRIPVSWHKAYRDVYREWSEGRDIPLQGTPIINWPLLSPAQVRLLQDMRILTVEKLAEANEEIIGRLGMGGRVLVNLAKEFLAQADGPGKAAMKITSLSQTAEDQKTIIETQAQQIAQLSAQIKALGGAGLPAAPGATDEKSSDIGSLLDTAPTPTTPSEPKGVDIGNLRRL